MQLFENNMTAGEMIVTLADNKNTAEVFMNNENMGITCTSISFAVYSDNGDIDGELFSEADVIAALKAYNRK